MKIAYFDCFSGISGDMSLAALLACGADEGLLRARLDQLKLPGYELVVRRVKCEGIAAVGVDVKLTETDHGHGRHLSDIRKMIEGAKLPERATSRAIAVFEKLADAEAGIHGATREEIHFHEVGAVDSIVDIVGACILLDILDIDVVACSTLPWSTGAIKCQHGVMPVPAPATIKLLEGFPMRQTNIVGELITPTGAALLAALASPAVAGRPPAMRIAGSGFGAGKKQFAPDTPNILRVILGETETAADRTPSSVAVIETNLDDVSPESYDLLMQRAFNAGALDVFFVPAQMKKNRPGTLVTVLCPPERVDAIARLLFTEAGTFGVRVRTQDRITLTRRFEKVETPFGPITLKIGALGGEDLATAPEYEDCRAAAVTHDVPLARVYDAARAASATLAGSG
ncbi:MAG: nickel pincer cofactor biosynthesis protein LarC [Capsulimonadaceae bacterium]|nr:nickel pincer cofactor biosynthesis protein LarC [Capsulimonadaceae bacterium]